MRISYNFLLLTCGFAFAAGGLLLWRERGFDFASLWSLADAPHPLFALVLGLGAIPLALWDIFHLASRRGDD